MQYEEHVNVQNGWPKQPTITTSWKINGWFTSNSPSHLISRNLIWTKPWASKCECSKGVLSHPIISLKLTLYPTYPIKPPGSFGGLHPASLYPTAPQKTRFPRFVWCCHSTRSWYFGGGKVQQWFEGPRGNPWDGFFTIFHHHGMKTDWDPMGWDFLTMKCFPAFWVRRCVGSPNFPFRILSIRKSKGFIPKFAGAKKNPGWATKQRAQMVDFNVDNGWNTTQLCGDVD